MQPDPARHIKYGLGVLGIGITLNYRIGMNWFTSFCTVLGVALIIIGGLELNAADNKK